MARVLLITDSDESHAKAVVSALESRSHRVTVLAKRRDILNHLGAKLAQFSVVILELSNRPEDWGLLDEVRKLTVACVPKPGILCLSKNNLGPRVKLQVERKGARIVYERPA